MKCIESWSDLGGNHRCTSVAVLGREINDLVVNVVPNIAVLLLDVQQSSRLFNQLHFILEQLLTRSPSVRYT